MSFIIIKDKATAKKIKELSFDSKPYLIPNILYMNSADNCLVCSGERKFNDDDNMYEPLVGHHVKYFPAVVAWVHYDCHKKIHDGKRPDLIQYENGDSAKYYRMKHERLEVKKLKKSEIDEYDDFPIVDENDIPDFVDRKGRLGNFELFDGNFSHCKGWNKNG